MTAINQVIIILESVLIRLMVCNYYVEILVIECI
jgi:hypothetical protein